MILPWNAIHGAQTPSLVFCRSVSHGPRTCLAGLPRSGPGHLRSARRRPPPHQGRAADRQPAAAGHVPDVERRHARHHTVRGAPPSPAERSHQTCPSRCAGAHGHLCCRLRKLVCSKAGVVVACCGCHEPHRLCSASDHVNMVAYFRAWPRAKDGRHCWIPLRC